MVGKPQNSDVIQEVLQAERAWVDAHRRLDVDQLDGLMAEDYVLISMAAVGKDRSPYLWATWKDNYL